MEIKEKIKKVEEIRAVERKVTVYIAEDGTEFYSADMCKDYEKRLKSIKTAEELRIAKLSNMLPITNVEFSENNYFEWYLIRNRDDFDAVRQAYTREWFEDCVEYPNIMCVERTDCQEYEGDAYSYFLTSLMGEMMDFWRKMGYEIEFRKVDE